MEGQLERRFFLTQDIEIETREDGTPTRIAGYAAVFNSLSQDLGGFVEVIRPGAFARSIREGVDVVANINHDDSFPLGRISKSTLRLREDNRGLHFSVVIPNTSYGRDAVENIRNGNLIGCSFAFFTPEGGDSWREEPGKLLRELRDIDLYDVAPVTRPAYTATEVALRCLDRAKQSPRPPLVPPLATILKAQYDAELVL